jgi:hypothetical protein
MTSKRLTVSVDLTGHLAERFAAKASKVPGLSRGQVARKLITEWVNVDEKAAAGEALVHLVAKAVAVLGSIPSAISAQAQESIDEALANHREAMKGEDGKLIREVRLEVDNLKGRFDGFARDQAELMKLLGFVAKQLKNLQETGDG